MENNNPTPDKMQGEDNNFLTDFANEAKQHNNNLTSELQNLIDTENNLKQLVKSEIKFSKPMLTNNENAIIYPNTINVIQGAAGAHKSMLAEIISAAILKLNGIETDTLNFKRTTFDLSYIVVYIDTERNLKDQLPFAIQQILKKAGIQKTAQHDCFRYTSLLNIERKKRFDVLKEYIEHLRKESSKPLFIVLDVSTDCIEDFNKVDQSMKLIDLMNMAINQTDLVFLCIIHENPKSDKARGHFGTELLNKASTVMQVGFEKNKEVETDILKIKFLKCRSTAKHSPIYCKYSNTEKTLIKCDNADMVELQNNKAVKADVDAVADELQQMLKTGEPMPKNDVISHLMTFFNASERTIQARLNEVENQKLSIFNADGISCNLKNYISNKKAYLKLDKI